MRDLSLKIKAVEFRRLRRLVGCGKSTLMRLMLGFEAPASGTIYFDGQDLSSIDVRMLRQQMGVVLQVSRVMPTEIFRNICGASARTLEDAWEAAEKAGLAEDIRNMPMGMHTYVSEGGGTLSGGQRQRLMIARAIVNKPKILFLDEATSALDNRTQQIVSDSMERMEATRIVIAHRLSTIINADKICYLDAGQIIEPVPPGLMSKTSRSRPGQAQMANPCHRVMSYPCVPTSNTRTARLLRPENLALARTKTAVVVWAEYGRARHSAFRGAGGSVPSRRFRFRKGLAEPAMPPRRAAPDRESAAFSPVLLLERPEVAVLTFSDGVAACCRADRRTPPTSSPWSAPSRAQRSARLPVDGLVLLQGLTTVIASPAIVASGNGSGQPTMTPGARSWAASLPEGATRIVRDPEPGRQRVAGSEVRHRNRWLDGR